MKQHHRLPLEGSYCRTTKAILLLFVAALVLLTTGNSALAQTKEELCQNNKARLAELEQQAQTLAKEVSYTAQTENGERNFLSAFNKAIVHPQDPPSDLRELIHTPRDREKLAERQGLPWKDEYGEDDLLFFRAMRDAEIKRIERIKYVLTHKGEIQQQKAAVDRQMAYSRNRLAKLACDESETESSYPNLGGGWESNFKGGWNPTSVTQSGKTLSFTNEFGDTSQGVFESSTRVKATKWRGGLGATVAENGNTINWDNGTVWRRRQ
jgi:hypothetical protein